MQFLRSILKISHLTEYFYTGSVRGARDEYQVCTLGDSANTSGDSGAAKVVTDFSSLLPTALSEVSLPDKS